jgi:hypothetical protein
VDAPRRASGQFEATLARRIVAVPVALLGVFYIVVPMGIAITETHKFRESIGSPPSAAYREVSFKPTDGVRLSGWYRPTENGATILVVHGGGGDRTGSVAHAKLLVRHGYGFSCTTRAGVGRARARRTPGVGAGTRTWPAPWRS